MEGWQGWGCVSVLPGKGGLLYVSYVHTRRRSVGWCDPHVKCVMQDAVSNAPEASVGLHCRSSTEEAWPRYGCFWSSTCHDALFSPPCPWLVYEWWS